MKFIPFTLKIGKFDWAVTCTPRNNKDLDGDDGCCDFSSKIIYIADDLSQQRCFYTLLHELTHALLDESSFENDICGLLGKNYERFVDLFSSNLDCLVYNDLKKLLRFEDSFGFKANTKGD